MNKSNLFEQSFKITKSDRASKKQQPPLCIWFTGLSGSGKSTLINALEIYLHKKNFHTYVLDGDNLRNGLCKDLGFSSEDRDENIRRACEVSKLMVDAGLIVLAGFISPSLKQRTKIRSFFQNNEYIEIYVSTPLKICEQRDTKGLYRKARAGEIKNFTGISSDYEAPKNSEIKIDTSINSVNKCLEEIISHLPL